MKEITYEDFEKVQIHVGTIIRVEDYPEARKPTYKLWIDLGEEIGEKKSTSQLTVLYSKEDLLGKQVLCVCNFPPRQVGKFMSEVLTLGFYAGDDGEIVIAQPERNVKNGSRLL